MSFFFFFKQKTAYEMRISDWSSDVCSSDLRVQTRYPARNLLADSAPADRIRDDQRPAAAHRNTRQPWPGGLPGLSCGRLPQVLDDHHGTASDRQSVV